MTIGIGIGIDKAPPPGGLLPETLAYIAAVEGDGGTGLASAQLEQYFQAFGAKNAFFTDDAVTGYKASGGLVSKKYSILGDENGLNVVQATGANQPALSGSSIVYSPTKYMQAPADSVTVFAGDFFISIVFKLTAYNDFQQIYCTANNGACATGMWIEIGTFRGLYVLEHGMEIITDNVVDISGAGTPLTTGVWHTALLKREGGGTNNTQFYIDDVLIGQSTYTDGIGDAASPDNDILLGGYANAVPEAITLEGQIKSIYIQNETIEAGDITGIQAIQTNGL